MVNFFFATSDKGFSGLCKISISLCHNCVNTFELLLHAAQLHFSAQFFTSFFQRNFILQRLFNAGIKTFFKMTEDAFKVIHVAVFASGTGSNTKRIIEYFRNHVHIKISLIVCNNPGAGVLKIAEDENIPYLIISKEKFFHGNAYTGELRERKIDFIVLAGFLWKIPSLLIKSYPDKIINIHPALLPKYGGKGMYGHFVHEAVIAAGEKESGISIHYVDDLYDHGKIIFQTKCAVEENDTPDTLAHKIHLLEHAHFAKVIEHAAQNIVKN